MRNALSANVPPGLIEFSLSDDRYIPLEWLIQEPQLVNRFVPTVELDTTQVNDLRFHPTDHYRDYIKLRHSTHPWLSRLIGIA